MRNFFKIFIIVLVVVCLVLGVMYFVKTRVQPPMPLEPVNQFHLSLANGVEAIGCAESIAEADTVFVQSVSNAQAFYAEGKIDDDDYDGLVGDMVSAYAPQYVDECERLLGEPVWHDADHKWMLARANSLEGVRYIDGTTVANADTKKAIATVRRVINDYHNARALSQSTAYQGLASTERTINQANAYLRDSYLRKNAKLVDDLTTMRRRMGRSHLSYVSSQAERLANYDRYSFDYYQNTLVPEVDNIIKEYENNASRLYGEKLSTSDVRTKANDYIIQAAKHYVK